MLDFFYNIDVSTFYFINRTLSAPFFDRFFTFITEINHWYIAYVILWFIAFFKGGRTGKIAAVGSIILITASDQLSSSLLKNLFARIRPCNALTNVNILVVCTGSYSFPSSHAVNNFAIALFFSRLFPKLKWILYTTAFLVAFSRPYVGVHYPSDIIAGAIIGLFIGYIFSIAALRIDDYFKTVKPYKGRRYEQIFKK